MAFHKEKCIILDGFFNVIVVPRGTEGLFLKEYPRRS